MEGAARRETVEEAGVRGELEVRCVRVFSCWTSWGEPSPLRKLLHFVMQEILHVSGLLLPSYPGVLPVVIVLPGAYAW